MRVLIRYFGMISEKIGINDELIVSGFHDSDTLKDFLFERYPPLKSLEFNIAINQKLVTNNTLITEGAEIALLPPFAGG